MAALIIFLGPSGAGKSVQADRLATELGCIHLSSGELLRADARESLKLASGQLVPSGEVEQIVGEAIRSAGDDETIILDGFPRTIDEAHWLLHRVPSWDRIITRVVVFEIEQIVSTKRLQARNRGDDSAAAQAIKTREYNEETLPVIELFEKQNIVTRVDGNQSLDVMNTVLRDLLS
jgi:adenylate kinase